MIYCISGLGADERVFKFLELGDLKYKYIKWETPSKKETLEAYCWRLVAQFDLSEEIILIGFSFGGIVAQEISRMVNVKKVIILASIKSAGELDWQLVAVRNLRLYKLTPSWFLKWTNKLTADYYFGVKNKMESDLLKQIIDDTDRFFMKWAIEKIMTWNGGVQTTILVHIHGEHDRVLPVKRIKDFIRIENGGHFMIVSKAKEVSDIINREIKVCVTQ